MFDRLKRAVAVRLWSLQQGIDLEELHRREKLSGVIGYLKSCTSGRRTREILSHFGATIDPRTQAIAPCVTIHPPRRERGVEGFANLRVGARVHIGWDVFLDLSDRIVIEDDVHIGMRTIVLTHFFLGEGSPQKPLAAFFPPREAPTVFRRGCAVAAGVIVFPGVTIGEDAIVGAGAVVQRDVPPRTVVESPPQQVAYVLPEEAVAGRVREAHDGEGPP